MRLSVFEESRLAAIKSSSAFPAQCFPKSHGLDGRACGRIGVHGLGYHPSGRVVLTGGKYSAPRTQHSRQTNAQKLSAYRLAEDRRRSSPSSGAVARRHGGKDGRRRFALKLVDGQGKPCRSLVAERFKAKQNARDVGMALFIGGKSATRGFRVAKPGQRRVFNRVLAARLTAVAKPTKGGGDGIQLRELVPHSSGARLRHHRQTSSPARSARPRDKPGNPGRTAPHAILRPSIRP